MRTMLDFTRTLLRMPWPWVLWLAVLALANAGGGLWYLGTLEGQVVLATFVVAALLLMGLFARLGFVRLIGLGHAVWLPLIVWLALRLPLAPAGSAFALWLRAVIVLNALSLVIDAVDAVRYLRGERAPTIRLDG